VIHIRWHRGESFHIVPLFHKLSHNLSSCVLDRIAVLLVKNCKNMYECINDDLLGEVFI